VKRIRGLLAASAARGTQSAAAKPSSARGTTAKAQANGRLDARNVEADIVAALQDKGGKGGECVYVKATGRAIARALAVGVVFQAEESEWRVRVEMGSLRAVDDVHVHAHADDGDGGHDDEVPETRLRTLSCVTVAISAR
jgi:ribonuclease P/MRP protein subunit POP7